MLTDEASFLIYQRFMTAVRAFHTFGFRAVRDVFLQGAFHAVFPSVDTLALQLQRTTSLMTWSNGMR